MFAITNEVKVLRPACRAWAWGRSCVCAQGSTPAAGGQDEKFFLPTPVRPYIDPAPARAEKADGDSFGRDRSEDSRPATDGRDPVDRGHRRTRRAVADPLLEADSEAGG